MPGEAGQWRSARVVPGGEDAGGGRRGPGAVVSREPWEVLAARWAIPRRQGRDLGGSLNLNLLVSRGGEQLVVRVHRPSVSPARLEAIEAARDRLDAAGVAVVGARGRPRPRPVGAGRRPAGRGRTVHPA